MTAPRAIAEKLIAPEAASATIGEWRAAGETVVVVRGVFDLPHAAHARHLAGARAETRATRLLVALLDDPSAEREQSRAPILEAAHRAAVVAALRSVDRVAIVSGSWTPPAPGGAVVDEPGSDRELIERVLERYARR